MLNEASMDLGFEIVPCEIGEESFISDRSSQANGVTKEAPISTHITSVKHIVPFPFSRTFRRILPQYAGSFSEAHMGSPSLSILS